MIYDDLNIQFTIENTDFLISKISIEQITKPYPPHSHGKNCYELHYVLQGNGQLLIDSTPYPLMPNTLYTTGPYINHAQLSNSLIPICEYGIYMTIKSIKTSTNKSTSITDLLQSNPFWIGISNQSILQLFEHIFMELHNESLGYMQNIESLLRILIVTVVRLYSNCMVPSIHIPSINYNYKNHLLIDDTFLYEYNSITLDKLSNKLKLSNRQTERLLQDEYGKTFLQKKLEARMAASVILLRNCELRITDIATELGYSSSNHFSAAFQKYYHISAREYRKQLS